MKSGAPSPLAPAISKNAHRKKKKKKAELLKHMFRYPCRYTGCVNDNALHQPFLLLPRSLDATNPSVSSRGMSFNCCQQEWLHPARALRGRSYTGIPQTRKPDSPSGQMFAARSQRSAQNFCPASRFVKTLYWVCSQRKEHSYIQDPPQNWVGVKGKHRDGV